MKLNKNLLFLFYSMIYVIWAAPKQGKTYFVTLKAIKEMLKANGRKVFSNYPIVFNRPLTWTQTLINLYSKVYNYILFHTKSHKPARLMIIGELLSSYVWKEDYIYGGLQNCMIILDEAYMIVGSRDFKNFSKDTHIFFATNGHDDNDIYIIAQHPARIDTIIREMTNIFYHVRKIGFGSKALVFVVTGFLSEDDIVKRNGVKRNVYSRSIILPSVLVKSAYDFKFFKNKNPLSDFITWVEKRNIEDGQKA